MKQLWTNDIAYQMGQLDYDPVNQGLTQCRELNVYMVFSTAQFFMSVILPIPDLIDKADVHFILTVCDREQRIDGVQFGVTIFPGNWSVNAKTQTNNFTLLQMKYGTSSTDTCFGIGIPPEAVYGPGVGMIAITEISLSSYH